MVNSTRRARCQRTAFDEIECAIPYHADLIAAWKAAIPYVSRRFDPDTKAWRFWGKYEALAITLLLQFFPDAQIPARHQTSPHSGKGRVGDEHFVALHLLPSAPPQLVDSAFRCLAKLHHPDKGGNSETMRRLTEAHEALSRRLSA